MIYDGIRRGDIYYIANNDSCGSEQGGARPGIIVSNRKNNIFSNTVEVVYLTAQDKKRLPTHVPIKTARRPSTALCEQVTTVDKRRLGQRFGRVSEQERRMIDQALAISLGLESFPKRR